MAKRWTKEAEHALLHGIGFYGLEWFQRQGGAPHDSPNAAKKRSRDAVYAKARALFGRGGLTRGVSTLARLSRETGYHPTQIQRAGSALNQKWKRLGPRGVYLLTDEQAEDILEWLKHDFWSKALRLYACAWCGAREKPHRGSGLCGACYFRHRRWCEERGVPRTVEAQAAWVAGRLQVDRWGRDEARFLSEVRERLEAGKVLALSALERLVELFGRGGE